MGDGMMRIGIKRAWARVMSLDVSNMQREIASLQSRAYDAESASQWSSEFEVLQAAAAAARDDRPALRTFALSATPVHVARGSDKASVLCRLAYWQQGDLHRFYACAREATDDCWSDAGLAAFDRALDAAIELQQLRFAVATKLARESIGLAASASRRYPTHRFGEVLLAQILYEHGELEQAEALLRDHFQVMRTGACVDVAIGLYLVLARIAIDQRKGDLAVYLLRDGIAVGEARDWQRLVAACWQEQIELLVRTRRISEARDCLRVLEDRWSASHDECLAAALVHMQCRVRVASGEAAEAIAGLARLQASASERGDAYACARIQIQLAEALDACGRTADALDMLAGTLELGCRAGLHQSFVSAGPPVFDLLSRFVRMTGSDRHCHGFLQPYASSLLRHCRQPDVSACRLAIKLRGPLSGREHAILRLMRHGSSNKLIARQLGIAPETVKSHAKRIFVKLGAQTRVEAVTKAASLSLI